MKRVKENENLQICLTIESHLVDQKASHVREISAEVWRHRLNAVPVRTT